MIQIAGTGSSNLTYESPLAGSRGGSRNSAPRSTDACDANPPSFPATTNQRSDSVTISSPGSCISTSPIASASTNLEVTLKECFGIRLPLPKIHGLKHLAARYYKRTYKQIIKNLVTGGLIHADETKMKLVAETGYVWVFTSLLDVAYVYRPTREGQFLHEMLKGFSGVLVTDFYSAYDSVSCPQQKCSGSPDVGHKQRFVGESLR